ncbi:ABC transporter substrate-binding protein [Candidatus Riflebacteria bacterium]
MKLLNYPHFIFITFFLIWAQAFPLLAIENDVLNIATIGPFAGKSKNKGQAQLDGITMYIDDINNNGGINGKKIKLHILNDNNKKDLAEKQALNVAKSKNILLVLGHRSSGPSVVASRVYKKYQMPAISGTASAMEVTVGNDWYFRVIFDGGQQGKLIAFYSHKILKFRKASIIYDVDEYGTALANSFEHTWKNLGLTLKNKWSFDADKDTLDNDLKQIIIELSKDEDPGIVFLSVHDHEGVTLLKNIRDMEVTVPIIGGNSTGKESWPRIFRKFPAEQSNPGYYTDGMYSVSYLIFDVANKKAQKFRMAFIKKYGKEPDAGAASNYDAAAIAGEALKNCGLQGKNIAEDRKKIRDYLARKNNINMAFYGATGHIYFDKNRSAVKSIPIGIYSNQKLISAPVQLFPVTNLKAIANLNKAFRENKLDQEKEGTYLLEKLFLQKIGVVYTGIKINQVRELDIKKLTCNLDFYLWFRFSEYFDSQKIEFLNALAPIEPGKPIEEVKGKENTYQLYRIKGKFKLDFLPIKDSFGQHVVGVSFTHQKLPRTQLIFVNDSLELRAEGDENFLAKRLNENQVLSPVSGWKINRALFYQDIFEKNSLGSPKFLKIQRRTLEFSRFNAEIRIGRVEFTLRRFFSNKSSTYFFFLSIICLVLPFLFAKKLNLAEYSKSILFYQGFFILLLLLSSEVIIVDFFLEEASKYFLDLIITSFDILWWIIPAVLLRMAAERFIWLPLEKQTGRTVPNIARRFLALLIYLLAFFGIIAFVFEQKLTSLLATSGVLAMIIGLAVQVNISNIFSGIAMNLENPFRIGDWIKIGDHNDGKVVDITWRTIRIRTRDGCILSIPNATASESSIHNFSYPDDTYWTWFTVHIDPVHPPERVVKILFDSLISAECVLKDPEPIARLKGLTSWAADYSIVFCSHDFEEKNTTRASVWTRVWTHLYRAGFAPAVKRREMHIFRGHRPRGIEASSAEAILNEVEIFQPLSTEVKAFLASRMRSLFFSAGETIMRQDEPGGSLFVIVEGVVLLQVDPGTGENIDIARLGAGNFFGGEMALFADEKRLATIVSLTDVYLFELSSGDLVPLMEEQPEIFQLIGEILSQRQMAVENEKTLLRTKRREEELSTTHDALFSRVMNFFSRGQQCYKGHRIGKEILAMVQKKGTAPFLAEIREIESESLTLVCPPMKMPLKKDDKVSIEIRSENLIGTTITIEATVFFVVNISDEHKKQDAQQLYRINYVILSRKIKEDMERLLSEIRKDGPHI